MQPHGNAFFSTSNLQPFPTRRFNSVFGMDWSRLFKKEHRHWGFRARVEEVGSQRPFTRAETNVKQVEPMTTLLFTIEISAKYRGTQEIYSAQAIACNGERLYRAAEALSISDAVEKIVQQMKLQERNSGTFK